MAKPKDIKVEIKLPQNAVEQFEAAQRDNRRLRKELFRNVQDLDRMVRRTGSVYFISLADAAKKRLQRALAVLPKDAAEALKKEAEREAAADQNSEVIARMTKELDKVMAERNGLREALEAMRERAQFYRLYKWDVGVVLLIKDIDNALAPTAEAEGGA